MIQSFQFKLSNERIRWFTDNQNVIIQNYSRNSTLQAEALAIFAVCMNNCIRIEPEWIPREQDQLATYYSRIIDHNDWMLNLVLFGWLDSLWGPTPLIDLETQLMPK